MLWKIKFVVALTILLILISLPLNAEKLDIVIKYLGLNVVNVEMQDSGREISVKAKSTSIASIAGGMDNNYSSAYNSNYLPLTYAKIINQKKYQEKRIITYNREDHVANRISFIDSAKSCSYPINQNSRDFFSALFYLRHNFQDREEVLWLDANKLIWKVEYEIIGKEMIRSFLGKKETILVKMDFIKFSEEPKERSDMLTNNLVSAENSLFIWFSDDAARLPLRAKFMMKPFAVVWKMTGYEE